MAMIGTCLPPPPTFYPNVPPPTFYGQVTMAVWQDRSRCIHLTDILIVL